MPRYEYPKIRRDEMVLENYHGMEINDPYRWLEDPDSEETKKFVEEQNKLTNSFLDKTKFRENIRERYRKRLKINNFFENYLIIKK
jgi:prolyl oligopeptidase